jgi:TolA-binding protein
MAICRQWILMLVVLLLGGGELLAANPREQRAYAAAVASFHDEIYGRAELELDQFVKSFRTSTNLPQAVLLLAQAQFKQSKYAEAIAQLNAPPENLGSLADRYAYWTGEAQFMTNGYAAAAATFTALVKNFPDSPLCLAAVVEASAAWEKLNDWPSIIGTLGNETGFFQRTAQADPGNEQVVNGRVLLARALSAQKDFNGAAKVLGELNPALLKPEQEWRKDSLLFAIKLALNDATGALALTTNLVQVARQQNNPDWLAGVAAMRGTVLEKLGRWDEAVAARQENLSATAPVEKQREAILKIAALAAAQKDYAGAAARLEKFLEQAGDTPVTDLVLVTLGELRLRDFSATNHLTLAQAAFDRLLAASPQSPQAGRAYLDRGWVFWLGEKYSESLADFKNAATRLPVTEDLAVALFKAADAEFKLQNFTAARDDYALVLEEFAQWPNVMKSIGDRALYQIVRANLELRDRDAAERAMQQLLAKFPKSELADNSLLLAGEGFADFSSPVIAREIFQQFAEKFPDSSLRAQTAFARTRTFEREKNWSAAITNHEHWLQEFPADKLAPSVAYAQAWANYQAGLETNAFALFTSFVASNPTNDLAPLAQWWIADYFFRAGSFIAAETNYEAIFQNPVWKESPLFYPSQLMAGRSAMGRQGFPDASRYLVALISATNCLDSDLKAQARFAYGAVLMQTPSVDTNSLTANLQLATNIYYQIIQAYPTNQLGLRAAGELADCAVQLGAFELATNTYAQVTASDFSDVAMRSRAQVGWGLALEKMAAMQAPADRKPLLDAALKNYLDVVGTSWGAGLDEQATADAFWVKKAGLLALPLLSQAGSYPTNFFDRLEQLLPPMKETLDKKRAAMSAAKN